MEIDSRNEFITKFSQFFVLQKRNGEKNCPDLMIAKKNFGLTDVMRCVTWYYLYNLKSVKNTHGGV